MIFFTKHAPERMKQRGITRDEVIHTLTTSEERLVGRFEHSIAHTENNGKIMRVFFVERNDNIIVRTVYKTSKEKYRAK